MKYRLHDSVDLAVLADIFAKAAGMMILLACKTLIVAHQQPAGPAGQQVKPDESVKLISFPLAYLPNKRSVTIALRHGHLYQLPDRELLEAVLAKTTTGEPVTWLDLEKDGVQARIELTPTATGFRFLYRLDPEGGVPLNDPLKLGKTLDQLLKQYPHENYFVTVQTWPEAFPAFRELREYLIENKMEVGWIPRSNDREGRYDIAYSVGEYSENLSSIKAQ